MQTAWAGFRSSKAGLWRPGFLALCLSLLAPVVSAQHTYIFSVVPQQSASKTALLWGPVLRYLQQRTGNQFQLATSKNIPSFERSLLTGRADFTYINPHQYVELRKAHGYRALVRARDRQLRGIVVVPKSSPVQALEDLAGQTLAFTESAFAATTLPLGRFAQLDISVTPQYVGSHDSVYLNVAKGFFPAGGGILRTLNNTDARVRDKLRVLWTSPAYTPHAIAAHPRVPSSVVVAVREALVALENSEAGRAMLKTIRIKGFIPAQDAEWDDVRALKLAPL